MIHVRKVAPEYFEALRSGRKRFELRDERDAEEPFAAGDFLALNEWDDGLTQGGYIAGAVPHYTGRCLLFEILYVLRNYELLTPGAVCLSLSLRPLRPDDVAAIR